VAKVPESTRPAYGAVARTLHWLTVLLIAMQFVIGWTMPDVQESTHLVGLIACHLDEVFVTLPGESYLLWRAVDQHGVELDILLQKRQDKAAAKRFFKRVLAACPEAPRKIVTDQLRSYPAAMAEIPELIDVKHVLVKASARYNNRAENSHELTRERERRMRGFRDRERTQAFVSSFGRIRQHFALKRHLLRASLYRKQLGERFAACRRLTDA